VPPRILRIGVQRLDAFERLLERRQDRAQLVDLGLRRRRQERARAVEIGIEALDHLPVGEVSRGRLGALLGGRPEGEQTDDPDREPNRGEEAEHADSARQHQADDDSRDADQPDRDRSLRCAVLQAGVEALTLTPGGRAGGAVTLIGAAHHLIGAADRQVDFLARPLGLLETRVRAIEDPAELVGVHLLSIGVSGETPPSSLPWFTPSARAM